MQFSVSSVIVSVASATIVIWLISLLLRTSTGYKYFRTNLLLGLSTFVMIRLIMPGELWFVHTLPSKKILPPIYEALNHTIYKNKDIDTKVITLDYSPRYLGHEIASGRSESNVWSVANTD